MAPFVVRWNILWGILFSVTGMCLLNYYSLFPIALAQQENREKALISEAEAAADATADSINSRKQKTI